MFSEAEDAIGKLIAAVEALTVKVNAQSEVLADMSVRLRAIEKAPPPEPPPAPEPTRTDADIRAIVTQEFVRATTHVLTETAMVAWINHFKQPQFASLGAEAFRAEVEKLVIHDRDVTYKWPKADGVVVSGASNVS